METCGVCVGEAWGVCIREVRGVCVGEAWGVCIREVSGICVEETRSISVVVLEGSTDVAGPGVVNSSLEEELVDMLGSISTELTLVDRVSPLPAAHV